MKAYTLFSSSTGNCFFAETENTKILIDCGVSARCAEKALQELGFSLSDINAIFVTHEHSDHVKGLETISKYHHIPIHMQEKSARALIHDPSSAILPSLYLYNGEFSVRVGDFSVSAFRTPHDSAASVGYIIEADERKIGYVTDMGCILPSVRDALSGCDASVIEANHDLGMLMMGPYPFYLKERIRSDEGHLSNVTASLYIALRKAEQRAFCSVTFQKKTILPLWRWTPSALRYRTFPIFRLLSPRRTKERSLL